MSAPRTLVLLSVLTSCCSCSKPVVPVPPQGRSASTEERREQKRQYVADLRRESAPIRGWVASESAGDERDWGTLDNPLSTAKATEDVKATDSMAVANMILASDIRTNEILFAPPPEDLRKLLTTTSRIVDWLATGDGARLFPNSAPPPAVLDALKVATGSIPYDKRINLLRATGKSRTYPTLTIALKRDAGGNSERGLAALVRQRFGYEIADVQNGILTASVRIPITTKSRKNRDLHVGFLYDRKTGDWIVTTFKIWPDIREFSETIVRSETREQALKIAEHFRAESYTMSWIDIVPSLPLVAE